MFGTQKSTYRTFSLKNINCHEKCKNKLKCTFLGHSVCACEIAKDIVSKLSCKYYPPSQCQHSGFE